MMYWFGGMGFWGAILMLIFWVAVVVLIVWVVRAITSPARTIEDETPLVILKRRYAAGEISQTEYEQARRALDGHGT